jgi:hypothetical protein
MDELASLRARTHGTQSKSHLELLWKVRMSGVRIFMPPANDHAFAKSSEAYESAALRLLCLCLLLASTRACGVRRRPALRTMQ